MRTNNKSPGTKMSGTTAALLAAADLSPACLDKTLRLRSRRGQGGFFDFRSDYVQNLRVRTGAPVHWIWRYDFTIQLTLRWETPEVFTYREESQKLCSFDIQIGVPEARIQAAIGHPLKEIAQGFTLIEDLPVEFIETDGQKSLIYVKQTWYDVR